MEFEMQVDEVVTIGVGPRTGGSFSGNVFNSSGGHNSIALGNACSNAHEQEVDMDAQEKQDFTSHAAVEQTAFAIPGAFSGNVVNSAGGWNKVAIGNSCGNVGSPNNDAKADTHSDKDKVDGLPTEHDVTGSFSGNVFNSSGGHNSIALGNACSNAHEQEVDMDAQEKQDFTSHAAVEQTAFAIPGAFSGNVVNSAGGWNKVAIGNSCGNVGSPNNDAKADTHSDKDKVDGLPTEHDVTGSFSGNVFNSSGGHNSIALGNACSNAHEQEVDMDAQEKQDFTSHAAVEQTAFAIPGAFSGNVVNSAGGWNKVAIGNSCGNVGSPNNDAKADTHSDKDKVDGLPTEHDVTGSFSGNVFNSSGGHNSIALGNACSNAHEQEVDMDAQEKQDFTSHAAVEQTAFAIPGAFSGNVVNSAGGWNKVAIGNSCGNVGSPNNDAKADTHSDKDKVDGLPTEHDVTGSFSGNVFNSSGGHNSIALGNACSNAHEQEVDMDAQEKQDFTSHAAVEQTAFAIPGAFSGNVVNSAGGWNKVAIGNSCGNVGSPNNDAKADTHSDKDKVDGLPTEHDVTGSFSGNVFNSSGGHNSIALGNACSNAHEQEVDMDAQEKQDFTSHAAVEQTAFAIPGAFSGNVVNSAGGWNKVAIGNSCGNVGSPNNDAKADTHSDKDKVDGLPTEHDVTAWDTPMKREGGQANDFERYLAKKGCSQKDKFRF